MLVDVHLLALTLPTYTHPSPGLWAAPPVALAVAVVNDARPILTLAGDGRSTQQQCTRPHLLNLDDAAVAFLVLLCYLGLLAFAA